jgi:hypothetical protein
LIHSEDREEFKRQLSWNLKIPAEKTDISLNDILTKKGIFFSEISIQTQAIIC